MKSSPSPPNGLVLDSNILSLLAKYNHYDLLATSFSLPQYVTPEIQRELQVGLRNGVAHLQTPLRLIEQTKIGILHPTANEREQMMYLPIKLGSGETEGIVICQARRMIFVTHDRKAANYCDRVGVTCVCLHALLEVWGKADLLTASELENILNG